MITVFKLRITSTETILLGLLQTGGAQDGHLSSELLLLLLLLLLLMLLYVHRDYIARTITDRGAQDGHLSSEYLLLLLFYVHQYHKDSAIADLSCKALRAR